MNKFSRTLLAVSLGLTCSCIVAAQDKPMGSSSIPKVLTITREFVKPGKAGAIHDKAESAFVQAMSRAKSPTHYIGMTSLSGKPRALFLTQFESFEAWEKDNQAVEKNAALSAALDRALMADGELLDSVDQGVFVFNEELSLRPRPDLSPMRYLDISVYHVRPGHNKDWTDLVKMVKNAYEKAVPDAHWGVFAQYYGGEGGTYLVLTARKSLTEVDRSFLDSKQFRAAMGEDGMKKLDELAAATIESSLHNLFAFNPRMSYVADEWIKNDDFWKPKAVALPAPMPAAAAKPASDDKKPKP
jgi:hypothetical protein